MKFYINTFRQGRDLLLAVCDEDILGKYFEEGELVLDIKSDFYGGRLVVKEEYSRLLDESTIVNLVGENCIKIAVDDGHVDNERILRVQGVPHAQIICM